VTGDRAEEMKGKAHQTEDRARRTVRDIKEDVKEGVDNEKERAPEAETVRERRSW
jgi:uncharacterized protein YjbJ (UPF0337 family)